MATFLAFDISWDTDGEIVDDLPERATVEAEDADGIADALSDRFGWCVNSFDYELVG